MYLIMLSCLIIFMLLFSITILASIISLKKSTIMQKSSPFECGYNPMSSKRIPFSMHFFLIAIIFLIFDVEIIIILPSIMMMKFTKLMFWMLTSMTFIMILIFGLYHEWSNGMLNWTK